MNTFDETVPTCGHTFQHGLCTTCLCPATPKDYRLSDTAIAAADLLLKMHPFLARHQAIAIVWTLYHRTAREAD